MIGMVLFAALFIEALVTNRRFKRFVRVWCVGLGLLVLAFVVHALSHSPYSAIFRSTPLVPVCTDRVSYLRSLRGNVIGRWLLASMAFTVIAGVNDVLTARAIIDTPYLIPYAFVACIWRSAILLDGRLLRITELSI